MKPKVEKRYVRELLVTGTGRFPFDMLRYDACYPKSEEDTRLMLGAGERQVKLIRVGHNTTVATYDRWRSYGWDAAETPDA
jgi:hypothetical protein